MSPIKILFAIAPLFIFQSCTSDGTTGITDNRPGVSGQVGELVVVMPMSQWQSPIGDSIISYFESSYPVLPQYEPRLNINHRDWQMYQKYYINARNVLIVNVEQVVANREAKTIKRNDTHARDQLVYEIVSRTPSDFYEQLQKNAASIITEIENKEIERMTPLNHKKRNQNAEQQIKDTLGISLNIPRTFNIQILENDFAWIQGPSYEGNKASRQEGIIIYKEPYLHESMFNRENLLIRRDSVLKEKVPGPLDGSYMKTVFIPGYNPTYFETELNGQYCTEMKGLWDLTLIKQGGPFVSVSAVNDNTGELVTIEAYVHAPGETKKDLIRNLEVCAKSFAFPSDAKGSE